MAALAAVLGPLVAYVTTTRRLSGKIGTSDADALWAATTSVREFTADQLRIANARIATLEGVITDLRERLGAVEKDNADCWQKVAALQRKTGEA